MQIVEHGSIIDREVALEVVMVHAIEYSVDQYASKVIEKAIKSGDPVLMSRYLDAITQAPVTNRNRTRMPLIDIASDQYGNVSYDTLYNPESSHTTVSYPIYFDKWYT